jgi:hypothetical protein
LGFLLSHLAELLQDGQEDGGSLRSAEPFNEPAFVLRGKFGAFPLNSEAFFPDKFFR